MSTECDDTAKSNCRNGCCRSFGGVTFCDIESICVGTPTWIIILVPALLGLAALVLLLIVFIRIKNRKVMDRYIFVQNQTSKITKPYIYHNSVEISQKLKEFLPV
jgi:hypothetical protein